MDATPILLKAPKVSILVAARNEAHTILRCLRSLDGLDFPKNQVEILIGNDQSTDATENLVLEFIADKPQFRYLSIQSQLPNLFGKTNVLAQVAQVARGEYFFFCDADISVHPAWVASMLTLFTPKVGVVVGVTRMTPTGAFAAMQSLEWLFSLAAMRFFSFFKIPFTGMGNNMAVTRDAYVAIGGYEKIGFSIVEDFLLFKEILAKGFDFNQGFEEHLVSESLPASTLSELLHQRKRWVTGAMNAPWLIRLSFYASAVFLPLLIVLGLLAPVWAMFLAITHFLLVVGICWTSVSILRQGYLLKYIPLFWVYFNINNTLMLINYLLPTPTIWKGRRY